MLPRFLLREDVVVRLMREIAPANIAEIGCGAGDILVTLDRLGFSGVGYDVAEVARTRSRQRLRAAGASRFHIVDQLPARGTFDAVLFLEVLGYLEDPVQTLSELRSLLKPGGHLVLSYARVDAGYDPRVVADMKFYRRDEVDALLHASGFADVEQRNYGFPLANALVGVMNRAHRLRMALRNRAIAVEETGFCHDSPWFVPLEIVSNRLVLRPFFALQRLTQHTDLGNGYVVVARAPE